MLLPSIPDSAVEILDPGEIVEIAASPSHTENEKPKGFKDRLPQKTIFGKLCWLAWEIITPIFWIYFFVKLFVFDIDSAFTGTALPAVPFWRWQGVSLLLPIIVPVIIVAVATYMFYGRFGLIGTFTGLVLAHTALATPLW